jgi:lincosamide nucleotidyltransferase
LYFFNEWGTGTAVFDNLVRGEFHFKRISDVKEIETWRGNVWFPSLEATLLLDRDGALTSCLQALIGTPPARDAPESVQHVLNCFVNWMLFGSNVLARGELARASELLGWVQRYLLWMARLQECTTEHWPIPTRALEQDISAPAYARYVACTSKLDPGDLVRAYLEAWAWGKEMASSLAARYEIAVPGPLVDKLDALFLERHLADG